MTPSIDERREVAERLRELSRYSCPLDSYFDDLLCDAVEGGIDTAVELSRKLADLIDPTPWERTVEDNHRLLDRCRELERELAEVKAGRTASLLGAPDSL